MSASCADGIIEIRVGIKKENNKKKKKGKSEQNGNKNKTFAWERKKNKSQDRFSKSHRRMDNKLGYVLLRPLVRHFHLKIEKKENPFLLSCPPPLPYFLCLVCLWQFIHQARNQMRICACRWLNKKEKKFIITCRICCIHSAIVFTRTVKKTKRKRDGHVWINVHGRAFFFFEITEEFWAA